MPLLIPRRLLVFLSVAIVNTFTDAQASDLAQGPSAPISPVQSPPYASPTPLPTPADVTPSSPPVGVASAMETAGSPILTGGDRQALSNGLAAARRGDAFAAQATAAAIVDPVARKLVLWAAVDVAGEQLGFSQVDQARHDLMGWPRPGRRQSVAEKLIETSGVSPLQIAAWFKGEEPQTPQGAMALAAAYEQLARRPEAQDLIRRWWRGKVFGADVQRAMLARFGDLLGQEDHVVRADALLYGQQSGAARDLLPLLPADQRALAEARLALRGDAYNANALVNALPASVANAPGLAVDRARYLLKHNLDSIALALVPTFPANPTEDAAAHIWAERKLLINSAMRTQDYKAAYAGATHHGLTSGADYAEAEFYAGWIALSKLRDPALADSHFAHIGTAGSSPITQGRALYWRGRAADARGDHAAARAFYAEGGRFYTVFYGQLSAERAGSTTLVLGHDPAPSAADRARFRGRDTVRAAGMVLDLGQRDFFRSFVLSIADNPSSPEEGALLVDMARGAGDQDLSMRAVRTLAQHGVILPERGYPMRTPPVGADSADPALVLGVTRQESGFDPRVRSSVGARGMMQLMPVTAKVLARHMGRSYSAAMLDDPDYNILLGSNYIADLVSEFGGSTLMAAAAYNAGPGRPADWAGFCGDPRASSVDPTDFIECIPFSETRNYVMRVLEGAQVYRARLHGGSAPLTLAEDLKRGGYVYAHPTLVAPPPSLPPVAAAGADGGGDDPIGKLLEP